MARPLLVLGLAIVMGVLPALTYADDGTIGTASGRMVGPILGVRFITTSVRGSTPAKTSSFVPVGNTTIEDMEIRWHAQLSPSCTWSTPPAALERSSRALVTWSRIVFGDRALPFKAVDIYLAAPGSQYRRIDFFLPGRKITQLSIVGRFNCQDGERALAGAVLLAIHELSHFQWPSRRFPNFTSGEAIAYTVGACASLTSTGALPPVSGWYGVMPEPILDDFMGSIEPRHFLRKVKGERNSTTFGILAASANVWHLLGGEGIEAEDEKSDLFAYCGCLLDEVPDFRRVFPGRIWRDSGGVSCGGKQSKPASPTE